MRSVEGLNSKGLELKNETLLNICHQNSDRLAKGLQRCVCGGGTVDGVCVCGGDKSPTTRLREGFSALSKLGNEGWKTPAQIRQQHTILGLI